MPLVIGTKRDRFTQKRVTWYDPGDFGKNRLNDCVVEYKVFTKAGFNSLQEEVNEYPEEERDRELLKRVVNDIPEGLMDADKNPIEYTPELIDDVANDIHASREIVLEFYALHSKLGKKGARAKN